MAEALQIIKSFFAGGSVSFSGKHYKVDGVEAAPLPVQKRHPPIVLGGGGRRMLHLAGREADIVSVNFNLSEGRINRRLVRTGMADATDEKVAWIREAAGERFSDIELSVTVFVANVTDDRVSVAEAMAAGLQAEPSEGLQTPHFLIRTLDQIIEDLQGPPHRFGIFHRPVT